MSWVLKIYHLFSAFYIGVLIFAVVPTFLKPSVSTISSKYKPASKRKIMQGCNVHMLYWKEVLISLGKINTKTKYICIYIYCAITADE